MNTDIFQPPDTDLSLVILRDIIGDWSNHAVNPIITEAFIYFNLAVLIFGSSIFAYTAIVGTLQSAHDGQLLGKKWSSVWVPFRFSFGAILLAPTVGGLCMAQIGMLWGVTQGVGIASTVWSKSVGAYVNQQHTVIAARSASESAVRAAMTNALRAELCVARLNRPDGPEHLQQTAGRTVLYNNETVWAAAYRFFGSDKSGGRIEWGGLPGSGYRPDICGAVSAPDTHGGITDRRAAAIDAIGSIQLDAINDATEQYLTPAATEYVAALAADQLHDSAMLETALNNAVSHYQQYIAQHVETLIAEQSAALTGDMLAAAQNDGWVTAGTWFNQIARVSSQINETASAVPTIKPVSVTAIGLIAGLPADDGVLIDSTLADIDERWSRRISSTRDALKPVEVGTTTQSAVVGGLRGMSQWIFGVDSDPADDAARHFGYDPNNPAPAIVQLSTVGHYIAGSVSTTFFAAAGGTVAGAAGDKSPIAKLVALLDSGDSKSAAAEIGVMLVALIVVSIWLFGLLLAYWLPMLPFVNWVGGVIGWFISTLEMLVATPVWIAAHLHPAGEGIASEHAVSGYKVVLELLLRPVLMIFGLIIAIVIADPLLNFVVSQFYITLATAQADTFTGVVSWLMKIVVFSTVCWITINFTFKAITAVPHGVMAWIGGMQGSHSQMGEQFGESARTVVVAAAHRMSGSFETIRQQQRGKK